MKGIGMWKFTFTLLFLSSPSWAFLAVIDPGHGGKDHGAIHTEAGQSFAEKDLTLLLAKEVARQLRAKNMQVAMTRYGDSELELSDRTALANRLGADVFLSLHMNSVTGPRRAVAEGIETYFLNNSTDESSKRLAKLENRSLSPLEGSFVDPLVGEGEEDKDIALILKDLVLDTNLARSKQLACAVQASSVHATTSRRELFRDRGVKQALFYVLLGADMPAVLLEAGFIHSKKDRNNVIHYPKRKKLAQGIAQAIEKIRDEKQKAASGRHLSSLAQCSVR